jgi:MFS superfamily sulfate permease-like transporter
METPTARPSKPEANWRRWSLFQGVLPYDKSRLAADILAGVTLAAMNIPQAIGYTKIAGMPPVTGLHTLLLPLVAFAIFGASRYLVVAADSATAAILAVGVGRWAGVGSSHYVALASMVALLVAGLLLLARLLRLGFLADFLSRTVFVGFLTGVGLQVGIAVMGEMLGIPVQSNRSVEQLWMVLQRLPHLHWPTFAVSAGMVAVIFVTRRIARHLPGPLFAVIGVIGLSAALDFAGHGIAVLGPVASGLPRLGFPEVSWNESLTLLPTAGACFIMIVAQSLVTARAYASRHHQTLDANRDLLGLCAADAAAAVTGTFVVNGSPTQTAMVETSGGRSQISHLTTAVMVALVLLFLTGPLRYLPVCALGAIVFAVAVQLVDVRGLVDIYRKAPAEGVLAVITAAAVVLVGVEQGIVLALVLSLLQHVRRSYQPHTAIVLRDAVDEWRMEKVMPGRMIEPGLVIYWFGAELFYANASHLAQELRRLVKESPTPVRWIVIDAGAITAIDYSAGKMIREIKQELAKQSIVLAFTRVSPDLQRDLVCQDLIRVIGANHIFGSRKHSIAAYLSNC